jgi:uncharacterized RDD family membrane protein YckC/type II secretory pathway pseudopilin PulG
MFCTRCGKNNPDTSKFCVGCGAALTGSRVTGDGPKAYAGFWARWAAMLIDSVILAVISIAAAAIFALLGAAGGEDGAAIAGVTGYYLVSIVGSWLYYALLESSERQATFGKRAIGAIVTDANGERISFGRATGRFFGKVLNQLTFGVGWLMAAFTEQKRGLHDYVAGTLVVNRDPSRSTPAVVIGVVFACLAVPVLGIVAAIAIPGLMRARMAGNETSAIISLRSITSAQLSYFARCNAYAASLPALGAGNLLSSDLTTGSVVTKSGYRITLRAADGATEIPELEPGCKGGVSNYWAQAFPETPGTSGTRYFATDDRSTIFQDMSPSFSSPTPIE